MSAPPRAELGRPAPASRPAFLRGIAKTIERGRNAAEKAAILGASIARNLVARLPTAGRKATVDGADKLDARGQTETGKQARTGGPRRALFYAIRIAKWIAIIALCAYVGLAALLYLTQRSLMYFPDTAHTTPAQAGLPEAEEVPLTASDGVHITAWYVAPQDDKPVIVYFHGNGGSLRFRVGRFKKLVGSGIGLVALEYRGFGGNPGSPSERGLIADGEAAYAFAAAHYPTKQIVLWGESLGTGVAVAIAAQKPVGRVILEAPYTSAAAVASQRYWFLPVRLLMKDQFHSDRKIGKVTAPLLILHGVHDQVVPYAMGEKMFELANKPKHIVRFLDGGHEDLDANGALFAVAQFLAGDLDSPPTVPNGVPERPRQ